LVRKIAISDEFGALFVVNLDRYNEPCVLSPELAAIMGEPAVSECSCYLLLHYLVKCCYCSKTSHCYCYYC